MKWVIVVTLACFALPADVFAQQYEFTDTNQREWTDRRGENGFTARLVSYNRKSGEVVLQRADESTLEAPLMDFSISDRRYLTRQTNKAKRAAKRVELANREAKKKLTSEKGSTELLSLNTGASSTVRELTDDVRRLYDIDWYQVPENATYAARGAAGFQDDKPIMWFRVLGDLAGYM